MEDFASWQLAEELHLENIDVESDYHDSYLARRTVDGDVLCDLGHIKVWDYNLRLLPNIEQYDVLIYLLHTCEWKEDRLKCYRKDNGHRLYTAGHIDNNVTKREVEKKVYSLCKTNNSVLLQFLDPPSDDSDTKPLTLTDIAESVKSSDDPLATLHSKITSLHDSEIIRKIEEITRGQSENQECSSSRNTYNYTLAHMFPVTLFGLKPLSHDGPLAVMISYCFQ
ncbi:hypothetical protein KUTeg_002753 [Tegillarca granosa]|uniref:Uncharacterized protein n=1 Tax=Tegillarca granosa TaxID=220873 RepID=A0ABQ9FVE5_TEGGR|nr:hypothetical protein KUTeg_002753 [Tegillarca granosa]